MSVEDRRYGLPRIRSLQRTPARIRFLSVEPLLADLGSLDLGGIDWVIVGGESDAHARPMLRDWVVNTVVNVARSGCRVFSRNEDDILREPDVHPRLVNDVLVLPERPYVNALEGAFHGIEVLVDRRSPTGLSGWAAYSYGKTRHTDTARRETFWGDRGFP